MTDDQHQEPLLLLREDSTRRVDAGDEFAVLREGTGPGAGLYTPWSTEAAREVGTLDRVRETDPEGTYSLVTRTVGPAVRVKGM